MSSESAILRERVLERSSLSESRKVFEGLISGNTGWIEVFKEARRKRGSPNGELAELLVRSGVPWNEVLKCLSHYYQAPFVEYDEQLLARAELLIQRVDLERLKKALWLPLRSDDGKAHVIAV